MVTGMRRSHLQVLLDIGAGLGFFSLAAAARGRQAIAVELSPRNLAALQAAVAFNGFQRLVRVEQVALGSNRDVEICVERGGVHETAMARGYALPKVPPPASCAVAAVALQDMLFLLTWARRRVGCRSLATCCGLQRPKRGAGS